MTFAEVKNQILAVLIAFSASIAQIIELIPDNIGKASAFIALVAAVYIARANKKTGDKIQKETEILELQRLELLNKLQKRRSSDGLESDID